MLLHESGQDNRNGQSAIFIEFFAIYCDGVKQGVGRDPSLHLPIE